MRSKKAGHKIIYVMQQDLSYSLNTHFKKSEECSWLDSAWPFFLLSQHLLCLWGAGLSKVATESTDESSWPRGPAGQMSAPMSLAAIPSSQLWHQNTSFQQVPQGVTSGSIHSFQTATQDTTHSVRWRSSADWQTCGLFHSTLRRSWDSSAGPESKHFSRSQVSFEGKASSDISTAEAHLLSGVIPNFPTWTWRSLFHFHPPLEDNTSLLRLKSQMSG